jgi:hypothetical protein
MNIQANSYVGSFHSGMPEIVMAVNQSRINIRLQQHVISRRHGKKYNLETIA